MSATDKSRLHQSLEQGLRFEKLVAEISARFINLVGEEIDAELDRVLDEIAVFLDADRCFVFSLNEDGTEHRITHVWTAPAIDPDPEVEGAIVQKAFPWLGRKMLRHEDIVIHTLDDLPEEAGLERKYAESREIYSFLMCPMFSRELVIGNIGIDIVGRTREWTAEDSRRLRILGEILANAIVRTRRDREVRELTERLEAENVYLREEVHLKHSHEEIIGESDALRSALHEAEQVGPTDSTVLIQGETGTGKELFARTIHRMSQRGRNPLVAVNCAALATTLIESELFGREKGAYTGALSRQVGRFELADGSTLFLDEVGELHAEAQAKLLRVLQSGEFERLGSTTTRKVDVRVIAATNRDLARWTAEGSFRKDLYYRLNVYPITVPPLRDRVEDIPQLVWAFVREFEHSMGRRIERIHDADIEALKLCDWPGNVRELRNAVERSMIGERSTTLRIKIPGTSPTTAAAPATLDEAERAHILSVLGQTAWRIRGQGGAAEILGLKPTTLESRMSRLRIRRRG